MVVLAFGLETVEVLWVHTPERLDIVVYLIVFVGELDVVSFAVEPPAERMLVRTASFQVEGGNSPIIETFRRGPFVPALILSNCLIQTLALLLQFRVPFLFATLNQVVYRMSAQGVHFQQPISSIFVRLYRLLLRRRSGLGKGNGLLCHRLMNYDCDCLRLDQIRFWYV